MANAKNLEILTIANITNVCFIMSIGVPDGGILSKIVFYLKRFSKAEKICY